MAAPLLLNYVQGVGGIGADDLNTLIRSCDTLPQLRTYIGIPGIQVFARGTAAIGDGGQGQFYWSPNLLNPVDDNANTIVPAGAAQGAWVRVTAQPSSTFTTPVILTNVPINEAFNTIASAPTTNIGAAQANYLQVTGTTAITAFDTVQAGTRRILEFAGILTLTNSSNLILLGGANITTAAGDVTMFMSEGAGIWRQSFYSRAAAALATPVATRQVLLSGTGATYTTPANCRQIRVKFVGGGGGGGGTSGTGGNGGDTIFNSIHAAGGLGGSPGGGGVGGGGAGGSAGSGTASDRNPGTGGGAAPSVANAAGGTGGSSPYFGGGAQSTIGTNGIAGATNTGGGGSGATGSGGNAGGSGGGGGEGAELIIASPAATYIYTIGTGGVAGTGTNTGGAGGSGKIIVDESY